MLFALRLHCSDNNDPYQFWKNIKTSFGNVLKKHFRQSRIVFVGHDVLYFGVLPRTTYQTHHFSLRNFRKNNPLTTIYEVKTDMCGFDGLIQLYNNRDLFKRKSLFVALKLIRGQPHDHPQLLAPTFCFCIAAYLAYELVVFDNVAATGIQLFLAVGEMTFIDFG